MRSTDLFLALLNHKSRNFDELKWPGEGTFEVILGAILVQNTNWKNVEKALDNLKKAGKDSLQGICALENSELAKWLLQHKGKTAKDALLSYKK